MNAHKQIGGEKINVSYAFAKSPKKSKPTSADSNKTPEKKPSTPTESTNKAQASKPGLLRISLFDFLFVASCVFYFQQTNSLQRMRSTLVNCRKMSKNQT